MACAPCVSGAPPTIASLHPLIGSCRLDPAPPAMATRGAFTTTAPERLIQSLRRNAAYSFWVDFTRRLRVGPPEALNYYCKITARADLDARIVIAPLSIASASMLRRSYFVGNKQPETP